MSNVGYWHLRERHPATESQQFTCQNVAAMVKANAQLMGSYQGSGKRQEQAVCLSGKRSHGEHTLAAIRSFCIILSN